MMEKTRIASVEPRPRGGFRVTDAAGVRYFTRNAWKASICKAAMEQGKSVLLTSYAGWYYRELASVHLVEGETSHAS